MADPTGFLKHKRALPTRRPVPRAPARTGTRSTSRSRTSRPADPGHPVHGLRHPVLPQRLPARQPDPGVERPGLPRPLARRHRPAARHQQLPGVHRPAVPGAVRGGLRARHQRRPGHHQAGRGRDHRPGLGRGLGRAGAADRAHRQAGRGRRQRARPVWPRPSSSPGPATRRGLRARRPHRRAAALRHPRVQDGEAGARPPAGPDGGRGHRVSSPSADVGVDIDGRGAAGDRSTPSCSPAGSTAGRDLPVPGRELDGHPPRDGVPPAVQPGAGGRPGGRRRSSPPASTSSSSAAATPAPTAWAPRTGRARRRSHQLEILPRPPDQRAESTPWPTWPLMFRASSAHEEGGERLFSVTTTEFVGDDDGHVTGAAGPRGGEPRWSTAGPLREIDGTDLELPCELVLLAMGFTGPSAGPCWTSSASSSTPAATSPGRDWADQRAGRVRLRRHGSGPVPDRLGHRRGPGRRRGGRPPAHGSHPAAVTPHALST